MRRWPKAPAGSVWIGCLFGIIRRSVKDAKMKLPWPFGTTTIVASVPLSLKRQDLNDPQRLQEAVAAAPGDTSLRTVYGAALANHGRFREAITEYSEALRLIGGRSDAHDSRQTQQEAFVHLSLGDCLNRIGETEEARAEWEEAIRLDPAGAGKAAKEMRNEL